MSLGRRGLSRRACLGGAGLLLGLPLLESLEPISKASAPTWTRRFIGYYLPNGMLAGAWKPLETGSEFGLSPSLAAFAGLEDQILVLSGLDNDAADPGVPGHHACGTAGFLTAALANKSETDLYLAPSIDQLFADQIAGQTPLHSLQLGLEGGGAGVGDAEARPVERGLGIGRVVDERARHLHVALGLHEAAHDAEAGVEGAGVPWADVPRRGGAWVGPYGLPGWADT